MRWPVATISGFTLGQYSPCSDQAYGAMAPARITRCVTSGARAAKGVTASRRRSSERSTGGAFSPASAARRGTDAPDPARTGIVLAGSGASVPRLAAEAGENAPPVDLSLERRLEAVTPLAARAP